MAITDLTEAISSREHRLKNVTTLAKRDLQGDNGRAMRDDEGPKEPPSNLITGQSKQKRSGKIKENAEILAKANGNAERV